MIDASAQSVGCDRAGCPRPRTRLSVFCEEHHRQQLEQAGSGVELPLKDLLQLVVGPLWLNLVRILAVAAAVVTFDVRVAAVVTVVIAVLSPASVGVGAGGSSGNHNWGFQSRSFRRRGSSCPLAYIVWRRRVLQDFSPTHFQGTLADPADESDGLYAMGTVGQQAAFDMELPTPHTVDRWDDASLFAVYGSLTAARGRSAEFNVRNEAERVLRCMFELDNEVTNGGFGQWLSNCHPHVVGHSYWACQRIGAESVAQLIKAVLAPLEDPLTFADGDAWRDYLAALSEELHNSFEGHSVPFTSVEPELLARSYEFARQRWADVRTG